MITESVVKAVSVPSATPLSISAAPLAELAASPTAAAEAAVKIAAQVAIVSGFDAVAATAVANARRGDATSSSASPAEAHPERAPERARADHAEHERADQPEGHLQGVGLEQACRAGEAEPGVEQVDQRRAGPDRDAARERSAQHAANAEERDRTRLRAHEEPESESDGERGHVGTVRPRASCRSSAASRSSHCAPTSAIHSSASDIGAGVGR